jgi:autotransporter translocation and assembly factor TamB
LDIPRVDVSRLANFVPAAKSLRGSVSGGFDATGTLAKPVLNGKLELSDGEIVWKNRKIETISGIAASLELARERIVLKGLKASSVGGSLSGGGYLALKDFKPDVLDVNVVARQVPLRRDESLIVRANAELRLSGSWQKALLSGRVGVVDGLFYRDIEILPIGTPFLVPPTATLPRLDRLEKPVGTMREPFRDWTMDLRLHTEKPFLIRGNVAAGRIDGSLRVRGGFERPLPEGELRVTDFKASLPFSTLTVPSGTARFTPQNGMDPVLEIRGFAEPRPYRVNIQVYGRASNPQMVLISNPPLPDNEIMTLLATGATTKGLEDPQAASSRALQLLAEEFRRGRFVVGKRLRPLLGMLDRVDFTVAEQDPYSSDSFSTATLEITDRWYLSAGMDAEGDSRVFGIWRLTFR